MKRVWCGVAEPMTFRCGGRDTRGRLMRSFLLTFCGAVSCCIVGWLPAPEDVSDDDDPSEDWLSERLASDDVATILRDSDLACTGIRRGAGLLFFSIIRGKLLVVTSCS